jgi:HJR/Mrr/RecB family endonuclease
MDRKTKDEIIHNIERLESTSSPVHPREAESILMNILGPLLAEDKYSISPTARTRDGGFDIIASRPPSSDYQANSIGIQQKHYRSGAPIRPELVRELLGAAVLQELDRAMLVINTRFTRSAREIVRRNLPIQLELIGL